MANIPDLKVGITFPGETLAVAILEYARVCRETMSETNRNNLDALAIKGIEDWQNFWRGLAGK